MFCANDLLALGVLQEMTTHRIGVPDEVAIVGYDDVDFAAAAAVPLSSVRQPRHQLGRAAAQLLIEEALGDGTHRHRQVVFEPDLVVRASSKGRAAAARAAGERTVRRQADPMRIALFVTCLADTLFPDAGRATVRLLERLGHQVEFPAAQTCCGQMHVNTGYRRDALPLVRRYVEVFEDCEAIVVPSGSCTGSIRHQHAMVARRYGDEALARRAEAVAARTYELSELLVDVLGVEDVGAYYPHRVTYHPTCHSLRMLRVGDRPLRLLRNVAGIDLVELPDADTCCGFGGTFAVKNADTSTAMLADKMRSVLDTRAEVCTAGDSSCLMHIGGGLSRLRAGIRTVHLAEILASTDRRARRTDATGPSTSACPPRRAASATCAAPSRSRPRPAARWPTPSCAATCGQATAHDPRPSGPRWSASCRTGKQLRDAGAGHQDPDPGPPGPLPGAAGGAGHRARRRGALGPGRERGQPRS